jgi:cytolysin-activating lysine-acyltransferase
MDANETNDTTLANAKAGLAKLPIIGPAMWLYARDPVRRFSFVADMDWQLLPPVVLDQCQLFTRNEIPVAFITWAFVSDQVDARLRSGIARLAPHEWNSGTHVWLIDAVSPFGSADDMVTTLRQTKLAGHSVSALAQASDPAPGHPASVRTWEPAMLDAKPQDDAR